MTEICAPKHLKLSDASLGKPIVLALLSECFSPHIDVTANLMVGGGGTPYN